MLEDLYSQISLEIYIYIYIYIHILKTNHNSHVNNISNQLSKLPNSI